MLARTQQPATSASTTGASPTLFANQGGGKTKADIVKMYYDISALPLKKRKASFRNASPNDKSDLWRTHLALFLVNRPELNEWQKEIILSAMTLATPELFEVRPSDSAWRAKVREPLRSLEEQIFNAFSLEDAAKIFATLGDDAESAKSSAPILLKSINYQPLSDSGPYEQWTQSQLSQEDFELQRAACDCSTQSDYCPIWSACGGSSCNSSGGCGTFWSYTCNGACQ